MGYNLCGSSTATTRDQSHEALDEREHLESQVTTAFSSYRVMRLPNPVKRETVCHDSYHSLWNTVKFCLWKIKIPILVEIFFSFLALSKGYKQVEFSPPLLKRKRINQHNNKKNPQNNLVLNLVSRTATSVLLLNHLKCE